MAQNPDFAAGDFTTPRGAASMMLQWQRLKAARDELGPSKTVDQWRVAWRDQKAKARKEGGAANKFIQATGNIGDVPELSENSSMVLSTIGAEMAVGCGPPESPVGFSGHIFEYGEVEVIMAPLSPAPLPPPPPPPPPPMSSTPPSPPMFSPLPPPPLFAMPLLPPQPPLPVAPTHNAGSIPATRRRERVRKSHPPDRFLAAQMELNSLVKELVMQNAQHIQTQKELVQQLTIQNRLLRKHLNRK